MECVKLVEDHYKFYASFENSHCRDFITEKLFNHLGRFYIPIVYGAGDYKVRVPPKSIIDAADFKTVEDLARFLNEVQQRPDLYYPYFWWHKYYKAFSSNQEKLSYSFCNLCIKLHESHTEYVTKYRKNINE
jgi:alpha-1,3-fucosyltransferase